VSKWGTKAWLFRYERNGRERQMGLGPLHTISRVNSRPSNAGCCCAALTRSRNAILCAPRAG
jgi:hypothetical protein